jgi:hypothetical protein
MHRRSLLQLLAAAVAALPLRGTLAQAQALPLDEPSVETLRAIAPAVLPSDLGPAGADAVVDEFLQWLRGYRSGADMGSGYGIVRKRLTPALDVGVYASQLAALEQAATAAGARLRDRPMAERQRLIGEALDRAGVDDFPAAPDGAHVATDFVSFYFTSSAANDLCYGAQIGRGRCRTLAGSSQRPKPLNA